MNDFAAIIGPDRPAPNRREITQPVVIFLVLSAGPRYTHKRPEIAFATAAGRNKPSEILVTPCSESL